MLWPSTGEAPSQGFLECRNSRLISMMLINSLLSHATDSHWSELTSELERLNVRKAVTVCPALVDIANCSLSNQIVEFNVSTNESF